MKKYILFFFLLPAFFWACREDKGTYNYQEVNELTIDTLRNQTLEVYDTLRMEPKVFESLSGGELEYVWYRYIGKTLDVDTLSTEPILNYKVTLNLGTYPIYLKVTDMKTGLSAKGTFMLNVVGQFSTGLMVLGEVDGETDLTFINSAGKVTNMYGPGNSGILGTHPVQIANASCPNISYLQDMLLLCDDGVGGVSLNSGDFSVSKNFPELFFLAPEKIKPQAYYRGIMHPYIGGLADFVINDGKLCGRLTGYAEDFGTLTAFNPPYSGDYEMALSAIVGGICNLFYDNKNGRFWVVKGDMMSLDDKFSSLTGKGESFDPNNVGMEAVYMAEGASNGDIKRGFGLFRNKTNQLYSLIFLLDSYSSFEAGKNTMELFARTPVTSDAVGIGSASGYATSLAKPFIYYSYGSKIYIYAPETNTCFPVYDTDTVVANSQIDKIYMEYYPDFQCGSSSAIYNTVLYVASSENGKAGRNGTIHILKLADHGAVESRQALYPNICGKTVSICYKR